MLFFLLLILVCSANATEQAPVYLYGVEFTRPATELQIAHKTYEVIQEIISPRKLIVKNVPLKEFDQILEKKDADIVITNSGIYRRHILNGWRDLVTLATGIQPDPDHAVGSLLLSRKGSGITSLEHLKGKSIILNTPTAFQGSLTIKKELIDQNYDPDKFFGKIIYMGTNPEKRLDAVKKGVADSTFVSVCYLERIKNRMGMNLLEDFDLVNAKVIDDNLCLTSTSLYPNYTLLTSPNLNSQVIRKITETLLKIPPNSDGEYWTVASDYRSVDNMYRTIKAGPYSYLNSWTLERIWNEFQTLILLLCFTLIFAIWHVWRTSRVVQVATQEIMDATVEQKKNIAKTESIKSALAVSSLSSIVAHELSQPLAASLFYANSIKKIVAKANISQDALTMATEGMIEQTRRANDIIKLVQEYAKTRAVRPGKVLVNESINNAIQNFIREHPDSEKMFCLHLSERDEQINISSIEFEIVISNLIKNSYEAVRSKENAVIRICSRNEKNKLEIEVRDNSGILNEEKLKELEQPFNTTKIGGLGLGITIVRSILTRHYAQFLLERDEGNCLVCRITILKDNFC